MVILTQPPHSIITIFLTKSVNFYLKLDKNSSLVYFDMIKTSSVYTFHITLCNKSIRVNILN